MFQFFLHSFFPLPYIYPILSCRNLLSQKQSLKGNKYQVIIIVMKY